MRHRSFLEISQAIKGYFCKLKTLMEKGAKNVKNVRDKIAIPELMTLDKLLE